MVEQRPFKALVVGSSPTQPIEYKSFTTICLMRIGDCLGHSVLFAAAIDVVNRLSAAEPTPTGRSVTVRMASPL